MAVHPHGCGERISITSAGRADRGSSPRLWGTLVKKSVLSPMLRFIPTAVGNAADAAPRLTAMTVHPHGCGERGYVIEDLRKTSGSSPRLWGTPSRFHPGIAPGRFIPTAVGNAIFGGSPNTRPTVHPHGCGERSMIEIISTNIPGSSPRLWGTPLALRLGPCPIRFIPTAVGNASFAPGHW